MTKSNHLHKTICFSINLIIVGLIIYAVKSDNSDKSPIILMVFYPILFLMNFVILLILWFLKSSHVQIYKQALMVLLILLIPSLILICF